MVTIKSMERFHLECQFQVMELFLKVHLLSLTQRITVE